MTFMMIMTCAFTCHISFSSSFKSEFASQGLGSEEEEEEVSLRIEKVIKKKVRINRKSHSYFTALCTPNKIRNTERGKKGVRFTIDTDFFLITFSIRRETSSSSSEPRPCGLHRIISFDLE